MMGQGMGSGYGGMMAPGYGSTDEEGRKFFEGSIKERRALHDLNFELREAYRAGDEKKVEALQKQFEELTGQLQEKGAPWAKQRHGYMGGRGFGPGTCGGPFDTQKSE